MGHEVKILLVYKFLGASPTIFQYENLVKTFEVILK